LALGGNSLATEGLSWTVGGHSAAFVGNIVVQ
jgi:hypothetical protein